MGFTPEQQAVIDTRNKDILVAAAAGSGKTTVLVERIISSVLCGTPPVDIDRLLVVTFTRAAAKEMKERIYRSLSAASEAHPDDKRIAAQTMLVFNAQISTIDSFCQYVIKNYFNDISIDPNMRIADEGELLLLSHEVMEELLEDAYQKADEDFLSFADAFSKRDKDAAIEDMITSLYAQAVTYPWVDEWLDSLASAYEAKDVESLLQSDWMTSFFSQTKNLLNEYLAEAKSLLAEVRGHPYEAAVAADIALLKGLIASKNYEDLQQALSCISFERLSTKKVPDEDPLCREQYKTRRGKIKDAVDQLKKEYFFKSAPDLLLEMQKNAPRALTLIRLVKEFHERFAAKKLEKNMMDFSDLEHFALEILIDKQTKQKRPAAKALSAYFAEVMIDEYQDTNYLQEMILRAVTKEEDGIHNYFMVGDVKQSIYRFRQARPAIFTGKYKAFADGSEAHVRIDLDSNFRSRAEVTEAVNDVFALCMREDCGGVEYDDKASLKCGADWYAPGDTADRYVTELMIADSDTDADEEEFENDDEREATMIAMRIRRLLADTKVTDAETKELRRMRLSDIAVLHRSANKNGAVFVDTFAKYGIAAHIVSSEGYFNSVEVETVLALLSVLNNPQNDIPLAAVLLSPMFGFTNEELLLIRGRTDGIFADAFFSYSKEHADDEKAAVFLAFLDRWRDRLFDTPIAVLLEGVLKETGYLSYVTALPGGDGRRANLLKLIDLAITYEKTSFQGLFYFVRYIERLKSYERDFGIADIVTENDDAVNVMTVHKSKGLEFPVVFVAGLGRRFRNDTSTVMIHERFGIGMDVIDTERRTKQSSVFRKFLSRENHIEERGEDFRVLYVAMTRAKEKLILTGTVKDAQTAFDKIVPAGSNGLSFSDRLSARSYMDLLLAAVKADSRHIRLSIFGSEELVIEELVQELSKADVKEKLLGGLIAPDAEEMGRVKEELSIVYPHENSNFKTKYAVSELKHKAIEEMFSGEVHEAVFETDEKKSIRPKFLGEEIEENRGAIRGTAIHRYMECFDFLRDDYADAYETERKRMLAAGLLTEEQSGLLFPGRIRTFLQGPLAARMHEAAKEGRLYKEKAFVSGGRPEEFFDDAKGAEDDFILVQGIIDVFFIEADGIVLVDYKTDKVDSPEELAARYEKQLLLYKDALERQFDVPVNELILYSFTFGEVRVMMHAEV